MFIVARYASQRSSFRSCRNFREDTPSWPINSNGAILDIVHLQDLAEPKTLIEAKSLLVRMVSMLSKMCR
jgi:hypothetical protein